MTTTSKTRKRKRTRKKTPATGTITTITADLPPGILVVGLGANLGDRERTLCWAIREIDAWVGPLEVASLYRSAPVVTGHPDDRVDQPDYLNTVAIGRLDEPIDGRRLLGRLKALENQAGRLQGRVDAPRPLDIDILLVGEAALDLPPLAAEAPTSMGWPGALRIPHARLHERRFVLVPLVELRPELPIPPDGRTAAQRLETLEDSLGAGVQDVERIDWGVPL